MKFSVETSTNSEQTPVSMHYIYACMVVGETSTRTFGDISKETPKRAFVKTC